MPKFIRFDENEDGTLTITADLGEENGGEMTALLPMSFDDIGSMMPMEAFGEVLSDMAEVMVHIPNSPDEDHSFGGFNG